MTSKAIRPLNSLFIKRPHEASLSRELGRCLYRVGDPEGAIQVFEHYIASTKEIRQSTTQTSPSLEWFDGNCINLLCDLYLAKQDHLRCYDLLTQLGVSNKPNDFPVDILSKAAVAGAKQGEFHLMQTFYAKSAQADNLQYLDLLPTHNQLGHTVRTKYPA